MQVAAATNVLETECRLPDPSTSVCMLSQGCRRAPSVNTRPTSGNKNAFRSTRVIVEVRTASHTRTTLALRMESLKRSGEAGQEAMAIWR